jgi:integrase
MAVSKRVLSDGTVKWRVRVRDYTELRDGKPTWYTETCDTEDDAKYRDLQLKRDKRAGQSLSPSLTEQGLTFGELADRWLAAKVAGGWKPKTERGNRDIVTKHLRPVVGNAVVASMEAARVRQVRKDLEATGITPGMVARCLQVLRRVLDFSIAEGIRTTNPAEILAKRGETPSRARKREIRPLTPAEIEATRTGALAQRTPHALRNATMVSTMGYAGPRPAELRGLKWGDWRDGKFHVVRAVTGGEETETKTLHSVRAIVVWAPLADDLTEWRAATAYPADDDYIFPGDDGEAFTVIDEQNWRVRTWSKCAPKGSVPYDARHGHASLLYRAKWDPGRIAYRLGHTITTLQDFYAHPMKAFAEEDEINPLDLILKARGVANPNSPKPLPDDVVTNDVTSRMASLSEDDRQAVLAFLDERQWDRGTGDSANWQKGRFPAADVTSE